MLTVAFILVVCSGLLNAIWNLFTKKSLNKSVFLWCIHMIAAILYMPYFIYVLATVNIGGYGFVMMGLSFLFQSFYGLLLARAYTIGDLSQVYPIMRGTGAMIVPVIGICFLDERLSWLGWLGLAALLIGIYSQSGMSLKRKRGEQGVGTVKYMPILVALAIGLCITGYTLSDKITLQYISPIALIQVSNLGCLCSLTWGAVRSGQISAEWKLNWKTILMGAAMAPGSYLLFLFAMDMAPVSHLSPIRESGIVFGTLFGILILKERQGARRILASALIVLGVILIKGWG